MTGTERIEAALSPRGTVEIPAVICYEGIYCRDHWDELTSLPWWYRVSTDLEHQLAWRTVAAAATPQDWFQIVTLPSRQARQAVRIETRGDEVVRVDARTGREERLIRPCVGGWVPQIAVSDREVAELPHSASDVDAAVGPGEPFHDRRFAREGRADLARALMDGPCKGLFPLASVSSPLWGCYSLWGFEGMMTLVADRPDLVARACGRLLDHRIRQVREAAALGAAGIWIEECLTDMIAPAAFESLNLPFLGRLIDQIRACGMKSIYYYCGDPAGKWDAILSAAADALALEEGKKGFEIDIHDVVRRVGGRCALLGNLDAIGVLGGAHEPPLRAAIADQVAAGRANGGRFITSIGSPVTPGTSVERVRTYLDLAHELGRA